MMEKRMGAVMTDEQVVRYTELTARRMEIVMHSGASWKPEYAQELEEIDKEIAVLRRDVDSALEVREAGSGNAPTEIKQSNAYEDYHKSVMSDLKALTDLFGDLLHGSALAEEINQQADQHFANMERAAAQYWESQTPAPEESPADAPIESEVAFLVSSEELHDLVSTYDEWEKLRCRVNPASHILGMDIPELYHLLAITGHDVMRREVKEFRETLEARAKMESQEEDSEYREDCVGCQYLKQVGDDFECKAPAEEIMTGSVPCDSKHVPDPDRQKLKEEVRQAYLNGGHTGYLHDDDGNEYYTTRDGIRHYTRQEG